MRRPSPRTILAVIAFGVFVAADDLTVVSTMLPQIIFDLEIPMPSGLDDAVWIAGAYLIAYVIVMPFIGRVSDIIGRRPVFITSLALFLAGSIWLPNAPDLPTFIAGRVVTALGGGAMVPVGMAIIGDIYPPERRPSALGILGAIDTAGWVWGPLYGALLVRFLDWRWQFYLNIPLSVIGIAAAWWALRDLPRPTRRAGLDWLGTAVLTVSLIALNVALLNSGDIQSVSALNQLSESEKALTWPLYLLAGIGFGAFVLIERRLSAKQTETNLSEVDVTTSPPPLIDLGLFKRPNFSPAVLINFLVGTVLIIAMINVPLLINVLEINLESAALTSGILLSAMTAAMAVTAYVGGRLTERWHYRPVTWLGLAGCIIGLGLMGLTWEPATPYLQMGWQLAVLGAGFGLVTAPIGAAVINAAPDHQRGVAASLVIVLRLMGMSVGLSGLTAWGLYRFDVLRRLIVLPPFDDPGYQTAVVESLTNTTVAVLTETFLISAVIVGLAFLVVFRLRKR